MLSPEGWLNGLTALGVLIFGCGSGLFFFYKSKKLKIGLLSYFGLMLFFIGLMYLGPSVDFLTILITSKNLDNSFGLYGILSYMWTAPLMILAMYIGTHIIMPEKQWYVLSIYIVAGIIFELLIFLVTSNSFIFEEPVIPGEFIIDSRFPITSPTFILVAFFLISALILNGFGFLQKAINSKGVIRKKYLFLSTGFIIFTLFGALDGYITPGNVLFVVRLGMNCSPIFYYLGLRPKKSKKSKKRKTLTKKELELAAYMLGKPIPGKILDEQETLGSEIGKDILVFISYATKDRELFKIAELTNYLKKYQGISDVLYYEAEIYDNFIKYMNDNLGKCDVVLLFCSQNALNSIPVEKEWTAAEALGKPIIPIFFDPFDIPPLLHSRLGMDFDDYDMKRNVKRLYSLIVKKCSEQPTEQAIIF